MRRLSVLAVVVLALSCMLVVSPSQAATAMPGFTVESFYSGPPVSRAVEMVFAPSGDLLVADLGPTDGITTDGSVVAIDPGANASVLATGLADPTGLAFGPGSPTWGNDLYIADHNYLELGSSYGEVFRYTGGSLVPLGFDHFFPLLSDPLRLAFGTGGSFGTDLYVVDPSSGPGDSGGGTGYVVRLTAPGSQTIFAGGAPFVSPLDVDFGAGGLFGSDLYVGDYEADKIFTVDDAGSITPFADDVTAYTMTFGVGGPLGANLYVHEDDQISVVDPSGTVTPFVTGVTPGIPALAIDPAGTCLYFTDGSAINRVCALDGQEVTELSPVHAWIGLKNSDDQGTKFDLRVELLRNGSPVASGVRRCIAGVTRNPSLSTEAVVNWDPFAATPLTAGDVLSLRLSTRIGTNPNDTKCAGSHSSAVGLRIYYDAASRASRFDATIEPSASTNIYLHSDGNACGSTESVSVTARTLDLTAPAAATAKCKDSTAIKFAGGNSFQVIGLWSLAPIV